MPGLSQHILGIPFSSSFSLESVGTSLPLQISPDIFSYLYLSIFRGSFLHREGLEMYEFNTRTCDTVGLSESEWILFLVSSSSSSSSFSSSSTSTFSIFFFYLYLFFLLFSTILLSCFIYTLLANLIIIFLRRKIFKHNFFFYKNNCWNFSFNKFISNKPFFIICATSI